MTDIVERLRGVGCETEYDAATCDMAADEIERLRGGMLKMASTMSTQVETIERLRAVLELYRDAVRIDATMEGPKFLGANTSALKRAWDADLATLEEK